MRQRNVQALTAGGPQQAPDQQALEQQAPPQQAPPQQQPVDWESIRGGLNKSRDQLDEAATAKLNTLNRRAEALQEAREAGKIRKEEMLREQQRLTQVASEYPWQHHIKEPGSSPGDIVEENGIRKMRTQDGFELVGYTPEYIQQQTVPLPDGAGFAVPVSPRDGYKVIEREPFARDIKQETEGINAMRDAISKKAQTMIDAVIQGREAAGIRQPLSIREVEEFNARAANLYKRQLMQAKNVYHEVMDSGIQDQRLNAVHGAAIDPIMAERQAQQAQQAMLQQQAMNSGPRRLGAPVPTPSAPMPGGQQPMPQGAQSGADLRMGRMPVGGGAQQRTIDPNMDPELAAQIAAIEEAIPAEDDERPSPHVTETFAGKLEKGAKTSDFYVASDKESMQANAEGYKDGDVVQLPDGRRYVKDEGQFWQVPMNWVAQEEAPDLTGPGSTAAMMYNAAAGTGAPTEQAQKDESSEKIKALAMSDKEMKERFGWTQAQIDEARGEMDQEKKAEKPEPILEGMDAGVAKRMARQWERFPKVWQQFDDPLVAKKDMDPETIPDGRVVMVVEKGVPTFYIKWQDRFEKVELQADWKSKRDRAAAAYADSLQRAEERRQRRLDKINQDTWQYSTGFMN
jgi:hypothetical protein